MQYFKKKKEKKKEKGLPVCYKKHIALKFLFTVSQENWETKKSECQAIDPP